jgi:23S rRNA pseudouridine1911/1915/1917 synthase
MSDAADGAGLEVVVAEDEAGRRLDQFLAASLGSRARAARLIGEGRVTVDGRSVPKRHAVAAGERVAVAGVITAGAIAGAGAAAGPAAGAAAGAAAGEQDQAPFAVAYEDPHLIVVDKPAGVVVHPARGHRTGTLAQALAGRAAGGEDAWRAGIVHRLDRDTSGLLVVAKSDPVHRDLKALLAERKLHREYLALVEGVPPARTGTVDAPIGRDRRDRVLVSVDTDVPREAVTHFEVIRAFGGVTLLRIVLDTGRTHQIRVHMAAIGHPVCGDEAYGGSRRFGLERQFLHAARLAFPHPVTGEEIDVRSPLPADLAQVLEELTVPDPVATPNAHT